MTNKRRILKTGALAIVVTIAFASFVFRVEEWTKALRSDFVVYGQVMTPPAGGGTGGGGGTTPTTTVTKILPQIAVGSFDGNLTKYATVIQIVNTNSNSVTVKGNFYKQIDGNLSDLTYTTNRGVSVTAGVLNETSLPGNSSLVITGSLPTTTPATYKGNWAKIQATGSVTIASFFEIRDGATNVLYSRVGVPASAADMASFVIPRLRNTASGVDAGFALVNTGSTSATLVGTLRDANGNVISGANGSTTS